MTLSTMVEYVIVKLCAVQILTALKGKEKRRRGEGGGGGAGSDARCCE